MVFAPWWFYAQGSLRLYNFNKPQRPIIFFCLFFSFRSFRNDVEYEVVILPSALLQNWSVWSKIVLHKNGDITNAVTKWQKQLWLLSHWLSKISIWAELINCLLRQHDIDCTHVSWRGPKLKKKHPSFLLMPNSHKLRKDSKNVNFKIGTWGP